MEREKSAVRPSEELQKFKCYIKSTNFLFSTHFCCVAEARTGLPRWR